MRNLKDMFSCNVTRLIFKSCCCVMIVGLSHTRSTRVRSFTGMGRITGTDYRNGLLYAVLSASSVFYMFRIAYSSPREFLFVCFD